MAFEPGGMADKLGNRYEGYWVTKQLLRLLNEEIESVTVELIGPNEQGVDLLVVKKNGVRQLQQCKARLGSQKSWSVKALANEGILGYLQNHLRRDSQQEFALITAVPSQTFADICDSARLSNDNPQNFFQYQIYEVGEERFSIFKDYCNALKLDPSIEDDLKEAFDYLKRIYIKLIPDDRNTWSDLLTWSGYLLTGEPETSISVLLSYAENNYKYRKPIYAYELRTFLAKHHKIYPKQLEHDNRIAPAIEKLQQEFSESIRPGLICGRIIPREETSKIIECIGAEQDVVLHGASGLGKSGIMYELTEYLKQQNIPYLPIRLDRRIPDKTAKRFGEDIGLPESPAYSLTGLSAGRKCVLILDQLDAIRWTVAHSSTAMDVCKELVRQVRLLCKEDKKIVIVFACRTFDLEQDQEIKNLFIDIGEQTFVKIQVKELSDEQLKKIVGQDFTVLTNSQKHILACPQNLAIWMQLKEDGVKLDFRSATELMRRFWRNRRQILEQGVGITTDQLEAFLQPLLDYIESRGEISAPVSIIAKWPLIHKALISYGILQPSPGRINFCHQQYLDYLIAERLLCQIYEGADSVLSWLGQKENQSLFRREQLRQILATLSEESPSDFLRNAQELLESEKVRFHLKHLILALIGQLDEISGELGEYCLAMVNDSYWEEHIMETVLWRHQSWVSYLLKTGLLQSWLSSQEEQKINRALWLLRSVAENIPDKVTEMLTPFVSKEGDWPKRVLSTICLKEEDDSERMFELRLKLARLGHVKNFVDWKSLCAKYPLRAICLIEAVISAKKIDETDTVKQRRGRLERWYDQDLEALNSAVKQYPTQTWDLLICHIERLTSVRTDHYDRSRKRWKESTLHQSETDITQGAVELIILAGQTLAAEQSNELITRISPLENSISLLVQEIIIAVYAHMPTSYADIAIEWLLGNPTRFRLGSGYIEPEWMPAVRLITALSPHCSKELFQKLEDRIIHYHAPEEKRDARYYLKDWHSGFIGHYWGKTQYFLLPTLDAKRIQQTTTDLIRVLQRKFAHYHKESFLRGGISFGGSVGSKLDPNLEKISDRAWLQIVSCEKITEHDNNKWIQVDSDHVLETSIHQFASSLARIAKRFPERFGQLALRFKDNVHPSYVSAILDSFSEKQPDPKLPEDEKNTWQPARVDTIEAVIEKYKVGDDRDTAISFCRLIEKRTDENWSDKTIARLVYYARNHPDLENGKLNVHCDKSSDEATVEILFQNTINCVRGVAAGAIGQLIWEKKDRLEQVRIGIESLIQDSHPVVRMAAIVAIEPVLNIDKDLAVKWFCKACKEDLRVAASPRASKFFNYIVPNYIDQIGPVILQMVTSSLSDVALAGASQVTARSLFHGLYKKELKQCLDGTIPQRKGVAKVAMYLLHDRNYFRQCQELLHQFLNDPDKEVRDELYGMLRKDDLLNNTEYKTFLNEFIRSQTFADNPDQFVWDLKEFPGSLVPVAEAIFTVCEELSTTLKEKTRDNSSIYFQTASDISSILLRLYEQAQGKQNKQIADRCLDIWDLLFENRIGRVIELARAMEK